MTNCFPLNSIFDGIVNNRISFRNPINNSVIRGIGPYGLYDTSNNRNYIIRDVSRNYPLTFYHSSNHSYNTISNIIVSEPLNKNIPIVIYVSKGQDYSFNNNDYFRFYDSTYELLNINHGEVYRGDSSLSTLTSNFYFMNSQKYKFIATRDICSSQPFTISGASLSLIGNRFLSSVGESFEITIPKDVNNNTNKIFYADNDNDISGDLFILRDNSCSYYYGDISFSITNYNDFSSIQISIKPYNFNYRTINGFNYNTIYGNTSISNSDFFSYSNSCRYITLGYTYSGYELLNKISAIDLSINNINNTFRASFNKNRHLINSGFNYDLSFGLAIKDYHIIDISKNFPLRLLNVSISNSIYIDETYQPYRLGIDTISGTNFYYGSLKIKVVNNFSKVDVEFISHSNNVVDSSYIVSFNYDDTLTASRHIVYDNLSNSIPNYDFSNTILDLRNQFNSNYNITNYTNPSNLFTLNLYTDYNELGFVSRDRLSNILTNYVSITPPIEVLNLELSANFLNRPFYIYYNVIDYENSTIQNIRAIKLNAGPIIEISNNYNTNNNSIFDFSINSNSNASSYNFYEDIKVFIYDKSKNKVNIPFELVINGSYFNSRTTLTNYTISYEFANFGPINTRNNYSIYNTNVETTRADGVSTITLTQIDSSSVLITNRASPLFASAINQRIITYNDSTSNIKSITFHKTDSTPFLFNITRKFDEPLTLYNFNLSPAPNKIDVSLGLSPTKFFFTAIDSNLQTFTISGNFIKPLFFNDTGTSGYIDLSYIGNYNLTINTKSLGLSDSYRLEYSGNFFDPTMSDISKTYKIVVQDKEAPSLTFFDLSGKILTDLVYFKYYLPRRRPFKIINDICFIKLSVFTLSYEYVDDNPVLLYNDNSIYNLLKSDLSFSVINASSSNIKFNANEVSCNPITSDASCIIKYRVKDICVNYSQFISLELNFINIAYVRLRGPSIKTLEYVDDLSYTDLGLEFLNGTSVYSFDASNGIFSYGNNETIETIFSEYKIREDATNIDFIKLGNYYLEYKIDEYPISQNDPAQTKTLTRLIKIVDTTKPYIFFPDLSFIIDGSNGRLGDGGPYWSARGPRSKIYSFTNRTNNIDLSFTIKTHIEDVKIVIDNFDLCDNYFLNPDPYEERDIDLSWIIRVNNNTTPFIIDDLDNYFDSNFQLNKVTHPVNTNNLNYRPPIIFKYTIFDGCNNTFSFDRKVNIVDEVTPTIVFNFTNCYNDRASYYFNYNYVRFDSLNKDFSYVAFNYLNSSISIRDLDFIKEISSVLFDFTLSDNMQYIDQNNFTITLSGSSVSSLNNKAIGKISSSLTNDVKDLFKKIGSSFSLIYDISDNQNKGARVTRNVKIIDDPSFNFTFSYLNSTISSVTLSFGDTNFNLQRDVSINHNRLSRADISYDISFIFSESAITSISGSSSRRYDPNALIYTLGSVDISYFPVNELTNQKSLEVIVKNPGPQITFSQGKDISHQSYTRLSDASLIFGVLATSIYDEFYYYNNYTTISYSETNFSVILDVSLNVNDPSSGTYKLIYSSRDKNGVDFSTIRQLFVYDTQAPVFTLIYGDNKYPSSNRVWTLSYNSVYIEYGANVYDSATKIVSYINNGVGSLILNSLYRSVDGIQYNISYKRITSTTSESIGFESINTSLIDICYEVIYSVKDLCSNEIVERRTLKITRNKQPLLYPYIEVDISSHQQSSRSLNYLLKDLTNNDVSLTQINKSIPRNIGNLTQTINYDLSLGFVNKNNNNIITCEAIKQIVFSKTTNANYVRFKLYATSYDGSRNLINSSYVDYSINSLRVYNSPIDYQPITFYAIDNCQNVLEQQNSITLYLKIIDTKPPNVRLLTNINFTDPNRLEYPLLSQAAITILKSSNQINYFDSYENTYLNYIRYYKLISSNIVLIDPGLAIEDIVDGSVNYINEQLSPNNTNFRISDISVVYLKQSNQPNQPNQISNISNVLTISGNYIQKYSVKDRQNNNVDVSRIIFVTSFPPIIRLNYQQDSSNNEYSLYLMQRYDKIIEKNGYVRDFSDITIDFEKVSIDYSNLNENLCGSYFVNYSVANSNNLIGTTTRKVEVYDPIILKKNNSYDFSQLISNLNGTSKFILTNGVYNFDVSYNLAFTIVAQNFDTSKNPYIISDLLSITSDLSFTFETEKYYYNKVALTISGNFERCSVKFRTISDIINPFRSNLINKIARYLFVYSANDFFINLQDYYNSLKYPDPTTITKSFVIDVSNLNNAGSLPFFTIDSKKQDLHLACGVYRFGQNIYKNFYNRIRFSTTYDGTHNGGIEYTKTVFTNKLPGISRLSSNLDIYTQITINATTPGVLYYYSENFKNMGGKIEIKNNIVLQKNIVILNSYVLTSDTNNFFTSTNTFLGVSNEKMNDRIVLSQKFDLSFIKPNINSISNTISNINICCITQNNIKNNIFYNLNRHPNKLIIGKHNPSFINTIYSINSSTYLVDTSRISFNNTYINQFNITYESSYALIKTPDLTTYDRSLKNVFYYNSIYNANTNVRSDDNILNYMNFFKNNSVIPSELTVNDFSYAISEFLFARPSNILNLDRGNVYANSSASSTSYLLAPRIKITNIIDNYVMFSLDVIYNNLLFQTFEFLVYSSRNTSFSTLSDSISMERLFFYNNSLVLANHLLYSSTISGFYNGPQIFDELYRDSSVPIMNVTQNMVFLNIQDNNSTSSVCGITKQNLYNNMYIDESGNFIFHKYNKNTIVNYQVNDANLTLEKTLQENSNNQLYLLDVCSNVSYNSFNNNALTINALTDLSTNKNYSIALIYEIYNEIDISINYNLLDSLYIVPAYDNDIPQYRRINNNYSTFYNYNTSINNLTSDLHSNCYAINLSDYFDVTLVNSRLSQLNGLNININKKNLIYTLQDISYNNNNFTLFNLESSFNIIYEKIHITTLNVMQIKLFNLYFKLKHLLYILGNIWSLSTDYINSISVRISYTSTINVHSYSEFFQFNNFLINSFDSTLSTLALNNLYKDILTDTKNFITIYNEIINNFGFFLTYVIILNPVYSTFEFNSTILKQLIFDLNLLTENIDNLILSEQTKVVPSLTIPSSLIFPSYSSIINIYDVLTSFYYIYNGSQIFFKSLNAVERTGPDIPLFTSQFRNLLDKSNVNPIILLENCKANLALLNTYFNSIVINNDYDLDIASGRGVFNLNIVNISNFSEFITIFNSFQAHFTNLIVNYTTVERLPSSITYINTNFELTGSQILIHSKISNSISLTFNIQYKSYFFNYLDLSTIVLDVMLPDIIPPTLVFANNNYTLNQSDLTSSSIINVITTLIKDVSYIDLNQQHTLTLNNTYYSYYDTNSTTNSTIISNYFTNSLVEIILPSVYSADFGINRNIIIDILYKIKDNANNINTITRRLLINRALNLPIFYYKIESTFYLKIIGQINFKVEILENINVLALKNELINNIYIVDAANILTDDLIGASILNASNFFLISSILLPINRVVIKDLSNVTIATYNIIDDTFINSYNFNPGRQLANNSITLLQPGTYILTYISSISALSNGTSSVTRILQVNPIVSVIAQIDPHCCYPKVEYKPIQDNYKLGSQNTIKMRRAKLIINRNR